MVTQGAAVEDIFAVPGALGTGQRVIAREEA
jgi:hypothetical protein